MKITDARIARELKELLPMCEIVCDDGSVIVNVPDNHSCDKVFGLLSRLPQFANAEPSDGGQRGSIWVSGKDFHEEV